jgi:hypothetical protein
MTLQRVPDVVVAVPPASLRPKAAAKYLGVSVTTLQGLAIQPVPMPGRGKRPIWVYLVRELDGYLERQAEKRVRIETRRPQRAS